MAQKVHEKPNINWTNRTAFKYCRMPHKRLKRIKKDGGAEDKTMAKKTKKLTVEALKHDEATRKNIPTAEYQSVMQRNEQDPVRVALQRGERADGEL